MRSSNPVLSRQGASSRDGYANFYGSPEGLQHQYDAPPAGPLQTGRMTLDDVVAKTALLLLVSVGVAAAAWVMLPMQVAMPLAIGSAILGLVLCLVITFMRRVSPPLILTYAVLEGFFLSGISRVFEAQVGGIVLQAVFGTMVGFGAILWAYKSRRIRVTPRFTKILLTALVGYVAVGLIAWMLSMFGVNLGLHGTGPLALVWALGGVTLAVISFALDFAAVEEAIQYGAPRQQAWVSAFGLLVGLVWLYVNLLRLLWILQSDD